MSAAAGAPARDKARLLERSSIARLRLRHDAVGVRESLRWNRVAVTLAAPPLLRRTVLGLVLAAAGPTRAARLVLLAGRFVLLARIAIALHAAARGGVRQRTDALRGPA